MLYDSPVLNSGLLKSLALSGKRKVGWNCAELCTVTEQPELRICIKKGSKLINGFVFCALWSLHLFPILALENGLYQTPRIAQLEGTFRDWVQDDVLVMSNTRSKQVGALALVPIGVTGGVQLKETPWKTEQLLASRLDQY